MYVFHFTSTPKNSPFAVASHATAIWYSLTGTPRRRRYRIVASLPHARRFLAARTAIAEIVVIVMIASCSLFGQPAGGGLHRSQLRLRHSRPAKPPPHGLCGFLWHNLPNGIYGFVKLGHSSLLFVSRFDD